MVTMNNEMKAVLDEVKIWVLATADRHGRPNAVPIAFTKILDDNRLMLVDNFMRKTIENIQANPQVSISVWNDSAGYQFKGTAAIETSGQYFEEGTAMVHARKATLDPKGVVIVALDAIYNTKGGPDAGKKVA